MSEVFVTIGISIAAFVSTNLDNLFLLMGLIGGARLRTRDIAIGYALSIALVLAVGLAGSYAADWATDAWLRYLGLIPFVIAAIDAPAGQALSGTGADHLPSRRELAGAGDRLDGVSLGDDCLGGLRRRD